MQVLCILSIIVFIFSCKCLLTAISKFCYLPLSIFLPLFTKSFNGSPVVLELGIAHFYGKKAGGTAESTPEPESNDIDDTILAADPADIDLAGVVKRRRVLAARAAAEKAVKEKEDKIR